MRVALLLLLMMMMTCTAAAAADAAAVSAAMVLRSTMAPKNMLPTRLPSRPTARTCRYAVPQQAALTILLLLFNRSLCQHNVALR